jgi:hypothetical protein
MSTITATLSPTSPRYWSWYRVFGSNQVTLVQPPDAPDAKPGMFYALDVSVLDAGQRKRLIVYVARLFKMEVQDAAATIDSGGCPILAEDVIIGQ